MQLSGAEATAAKRIEYRVSIPNIRTDDICIRKKRSVRNMYYKRTVRLQV
jgi:hypothetical protein